MKLSKFILLLPFLFTACKTKPVQEKIMAFENDDAYLWLEDVEGEKAIKFANDESAISVQRLKKNPFFEKIESDARKVVLAKDRVPSVELMNGELYNFWQDNVNVRGVYRKTSIESYKSGHPKWEVILDIDALAKEENENWVWQGMMELPPHYEKAILHLSRGGKDAGVAREFNLKTKQFVKGGFELPEAKSNMAWKDENTVYVATDFGPGSMTDSGYPRVVKEWKRGTPLTSAKLVHEATQTDMSARTWVYFGKDKNYIIHSRRMGFYAGMSWYEDEQGRKIKLPMPDDAELNAIFKDYFLFSLRSDLGAFKAGSLVALPLDQISKGEKAQESLQLVFAPTDKKFLSWAVASENHLLLMTMDNVLSKIIKVTLKGPGQWQQEEINLGKNGMTTLVGTEWGSDRYLANYQDFLTPQTTYILSAADPKNKGEVLQKYPARFNSQDLEVQRHEATSADGTKIPYFLVGKKGLKFNGKNPTLLYGYGGFEIPMQPNYAGLMGKLWLEKGGVYVLSNLRGGGEFGPNWHKSVLQENRYKVYQDFIAIAEDLIAKKVTTPAHLGIKGGSNGGLLTGATVTLRPDLFNAVLVQVPLLDMIRYHKLLAGASWMDEYGNPDDPKMREAILKYSPYQNVKADSKYPEVFFMTSTKDDRVHPGHARKMYAKMQAQGHKVMYYENTEGGHGRAANLEQSILWSALEFSYLWEKIGPEKTH